MHATLTRYLQIELAALGYEPGDWPDDTSRSRRPRIYWSLSSCQGDGVAWEGRCDLLKLASRLLRGAQRAGAIRAIEKGDGQGVVAHTGRYTHAYAMTARLELGDEDACTVFERRSFDALAEAVAQDVVATSLRLEREGYAYLRNANPAWFHGKAITTCFDEISWALHRDRKAGRFRMRVTLLEDPWFDGYGSGETEADHADVKRIVAGSAVVYRMRAEAMDVTGRFVLGTATSDTLVDHPDLRFGREKLVRDLLRDAKGEARDTIATLSRRAA
jgi:hypothetical protein